jgi:hypothetical protein
MAGLLVQLLEQTMYRVRKYKNESYDSTID